MAASSSEFQMTVDKLSLIEGAEPTGESLPSGGEIDEIIEISRLSEELSLDDPDREFFYTCSD